MKNIIVVDYVKNCSCYIWAQFMELDQTNVKSVDTVVSNKGKMTNK